MQFRVYVTNPRGEPEIVEVDASSPDGARILAQKKFRQKVVISKVKAVSPKSTENRPNA